MQTVSADTIREPRHLCLAAKSIRKSTAPKWICIKYRDGETYWVRRVYKSSSGCNLVSYRRFAK